MRLEGNVSVLILTTGILSACGHQQPVESTAILPADLPNITSAVPTQDKGETSGFSAQGVNFNQFRQKIYDEKNPILVASMQGLPADQRRNIVLVDGNKIYSSDNNLLKRTQQLKQISSENWVDDSGKPVYMQDFGVPPTSVKSLDLTGQATYVNCRTDNSGPFSRVIAQPGGSRFFGTITLPSSIDSVQQNVNDAVHMYSGGWSNSTAVDAGFQRNSDGRYQAIMRAAINPGTPGFPNGFNGYATVQPHHFLAGTGTIDFFTTTDGITWLKAYGYVQELSKYDYIWTGYRNLPGWTADGNQAQVKFTTSVAQPQNSENFTNGSLIRSTWNNMYIGGNNGAWYINPWKSSSFYTQEVCSNPGPVTYPNDSRFWNRVESYWSDDTNYIININLR